MFVYASATGHCLLHFSQDWEPISLQCCSELLIATVHKWKTFDFFVEKSSTAVAQSYEDSHAAACLCSCTGLRLMVFLWYACLCVPQLVTLGAPQVTGRSEQCRTATPPADRRCDCRIVQITFIAAQIANIETTTHLKSLFQFVVKERRSAKLEKHRPL